MFSAYASSLSLRRGVPAPRARVRRAASRALRAARAASRVRAVAGSISARASRTNARASRCDAMARSNNARVDENAERAADATDAESRSRTPEKEFVRSLNAVMRRGAEGDRYRRAAAQADGRVFITTAFVFERRRASPARVVALVFFLRRRRLRLRLRLRRRGRVADRSRSVAGKQGKKTETKSREMRRAAPRRRRGVVRLPDGGGPQRESTAAPAVPRAEM